MPVFNAYTNTSDMPTNTDYPLLLQPPTPSNANARNAEMIKYLEDLTAWRLKYKIPDSIWNQWIAEKVSEMPVDQQKNWWQKVKEKVQTAVNNTQAAVQNVSTSVSNTVQNVKKTAEQILSEGKLKAYLTLFVPLVAPAKVYLIARGVKPSSDLSELAKQVANTKPNFGLDGSGGDSGANPAMIQYAIQIVMAFLQEIKKKKASNQPLTQDEQKLLDMLPAIENNIKAAQTQAQAISDQAEKEAEKAEGGSYKWVWYVLIFVLLLFVYLKFVR